MGSINSLLSFWITNDLDKGHLEYVFGIIAALTLIATVAYIYVSRAFDTTCGLEYENDEQYRLMNETGLSPDWQRHPTRIYREKKQRSLSAAI